MKNRHIKVRSTCIQKCPRPQCSREYSMKISRCECGYELPKPDDVYERICDNCGYKVRYPEAYNIKICPNCDGEFVSDSFTCNECPDQNTQICNKCPLKGG